MASFYSRSQGLSLAMMAARARLGGACVCGDGDLYACVLDADAALLQMPSITLTSLPLLAAVHNVPINTQNPSDPLTLKYIFHSNPN